MVKFSSQIVSMGGNWRPEKAKIKSLTTKRTNQIYTHPEYCTADVSLDFLVKVGPKGTFSESLKGAFLSGFWAV